MLGSSGAYGDDIESTLEVWIFGVFVATPPIAGLVVTSNSATDDQELCGRCWLRRSARWLDSENVCPDSGASRVKCSDWCCCEGEKWAPGDALSKEWAKG